MADLAASLVSKYFPKSGNSLVIGDVSVVQLAEIYGTPIFIYDRAVLDQKFDALRSALPARLIHSRARPARCSRAMPAIRS